MKKVIFWDFDGTLVYANESFAESLQKAFKQCDHQIEYGEIKKFLTSACSWYKPEISYTHETGEGWWQTLLTGTKAFCMEKGVSVANIDVICEAFRENVIGYDYKVYEDSEEILQYYLQKGYRNYILSNNYPELTEVICRLGLDKYFDGFIISSHVGYEKPRKELYAYARETAGNPDVCYMVGDNPIADVKGAEVAGIPAILVHRKEAAASVERYCEQLAETSKYMIE